MQMNWRRQLKGMLRIAMAYVALNIACVHYDNGIESIPVDIAISVLDTNNSRPVLHAVASWQERARDFDCQQVVNLLNESAKDRSSKCGILSPSEGFGWEFAVLCQKLGLPDDAIPMNVIGMTTKNGRLEFRAYFGRDLKWVLPCLGPVDASDRLLQVDAVGYDSKHISLQQQDFHLVDGQYRVNATVLLNRETTSH